VSVPVYGGRYLSRKEVYNWGEKRFAGEENVEAEVQKRLRQQSK
jgi:hypothetical protein